MRSLLATCVIVAACLTGCDSAPRPAQDNPPPPKTEVKTTKDGQETVTTAPD
jgi:hypothetical protein